MRRNLCALLVCGVVASAFMTPVPAAAAPASSMVVGMWPQSYTQFQEIAAASGVSMPYYRGRQRDGQFDEVLVPPDAAAAAAAGFSIGMNIQPKTGSGGNRTGILYTDITAQLLAGSGPYYDKLVSFANEVLSLPTYGQVTHYLQFHSEANVQAPPGVLDAQPYSGTGAEYRECYALVRALFDSMGVTDRIVWQVVLSRGAYIGNQGGVENWFPADTSLYDLVGVDSYRRPNTWLTPSQSFDAALAFARSVGKQIWIDETGSDEGGPSGTDQQLGKAQWFAALGDYLEANRPEIAGVVFSHAKDGGNWFVDSILSGGRASPRYTGVTWEAFRALVGRLLAPAEGTISISAAGTGAGAVTSSPAGIDCGSACSATFGGGTQLELAATPEPGSAFEGWAGACSGIGLCVLSVNGDAQVTAAFGPALGTVSVQAVGGGSGVVTSSPAGISCDPMCSAWFLEGTPVELTATADPGTEFVGWGGPGVDCPDTSTCEVVAVGEVNVSATFRVLEQLSVNVVEDSGTGTVMSSPAGIVCGQTCSATFVHGTDVELRAVPGPDSIVVWSGCAPAGSDPDRCTVTLDGPKDVAATFRPAPKALTVTTSGVGTGSVMSSPAGISCPSTCQAGFDHDTQVSLSAIPDPDSVFTGWTGACGGTGLCTVTMDAAASVNAHFDQAPRSLTVALSGAGTVTSTPAGISCGQTCQASFPYETQVTLAATPDANQTFSGWSGECTGTDGCTVTMDQARSVGATFVPVVHLLSVTTSGAGTGSVMSSPAGISCPSTCQAGFDHDTQVSLSAIPDPDSVFTGWTGACGGTGLCTVTMDAAASVNAHFDQAPRSLTVALSGAGTVTSTPAGISCGQTCQASFPYETQVTLAATPDANQTFSGWSGECTGTDGCTVTMDQARSVGATFVPVVHLLSVTTSGAGTGSVMSSPAGISCPSTCQAGFDHDTQVSLSAIPDPDSVFTGWTGACGGTGLCTVTMDAAASVNAHFDQAPPPPALGDGDPAIDYQGWQGVTDGAASGGSYRMSSVKNSTATWISPTATSVAWVARIGPNRGKAAVTIDGVTKGTVDLYAATPGTLWTAYGSLGNAPHTIVIKVLGQKQAGSSGTSVTLDAFVAGATTVQDTGAGITYVSWVGTTQSQATDGAYRSSSAKNATATVTFTGTRVDWIAAAGPGLGKASVTIDGVNRGTVDLYASTEMWRRVFGFGGLTPGPHSMQIKVLGQKAAASTGTSVVIDGFVISG